MNLAPANTDLIDTSELESERKVNLQEYLRVLFRYRWGILLLGVLGALVAAFKTYSETPIYRASSLMLIERQGAKFVPIDPVYQTQSSMFYDFGEYYQTQYQILQSRPIAERVVRKVGLDAFDEAPPQGPMFDWRRMIGQPPPPPVKQPDDVRFARAVSIVLGSVQIDPIRMSQLVRVHFNSANPKLAQTLATTLPQAYIEDTLEGRLAMTDSASSWLSERLGTLRQRLEESEGKLQEFRDRERLLDVKGIDTLATQELELATGRLTSARAERSQKETSYRQVRSAMDRGAGLDDVPALLAFPMVGPLKTNLVEAEGELAENAKRYGPKHPRMVELQSKVDTARDALDRQLRSAADSIIREYEAARMQEQQISGEIGAAKGEIRDVNRKQYEMQRLEREVETNRQLYEQFQTRFKETSAAGGVQSSNARLIEPAQMPGSPIYPVKSQAITMGILIGLALGVALAFLLNHLDNTLKGAEDVEERLKLPVLGQLPRLKTSNDSDRAPLRHFSETPSSSFSEAVRTIRTGVLLSAIDHPHRRLLITSSVPGEGKTTLAVNLAHALGQMRKTLLIDADMRRPAVHRGLPDTGGMKGLSQFVSGQAQISECVRQIEGTGIHVMQAGPVPPNPQELLSSHRFAEALESLSAAFDHVIIDCAPACAVSDALLLSRQVHAVVYVVRSDSTPWQLAAQGIQRLRRVGAPLIGAVVNQVIPRKNRYGYGKYYYYGTGYTSDYGYGNSKS